VRQERSHRRRGGGAHPDAGDRPGGSGSQGRAGEALREARTAFDELIATGTAGPVALALGGAAVHSHDVEPAGSGTGTAKAAARSSNEYGGVIGHIVDDGKD
jgi:hypothetical protein